MRRTLKTISLAFLSAALLPLILSASAHVVSETDSTATPAPAKNRAIVAKSVPVKVVPLKAARALAGLTCRKTSNGGWVAFDSALAVSRPSLRITAVPGGQNIYQLTTPDTLRKLTIANPGGSRWEMVGREGVLGEGVAEGAFVSFDAATGRVASVLVYQWNRATEREPQVWRVGDALFLRGRFLAVADVHQGRRIVQRRASEVRLSLKTGSVIAAR